MSALQAISISGLRDKSQSETGKVSGDLSLKGKKDSEDKNKASLAVSAEYERSGGTDNKTVVGAIRAGATWP